MEKILKQYNRWVNHEDMPADLLEELNDMKDDHKKIEEAFYKDLEFGTSGLRGIMGPGNNRMNDFVVARATQGLANYMKKTLDFSNWENDMPSVVISYDSRFNSRKFATITAEVFSANGIKAYIFEEMMPVSLLSFAVRHLGCQYGIMITASHNSKEYNGYKVYNRHGSQIIGDEPKLILNEIDALDIFKDVKAGLDDNVVWLDGELKDIFVEKALVNSLRYGKESEYEGPRDIENLKVVYSPLNGSGRVPVLDVISKLGVKEIYTVAEQLEEDGSFATCPKPNPEKPEVYELGRKLLAEKNADILIVTDPDCDRIGVATGEKVLSGNQLAVLLFDYICRHKKPLPRRAVAVRSIVSTPLVDAIAADYGVEIQETLIGFKYIGEKIDQLGKDYIFGFEEGNGYLAFDHMRDKDGVSTAMLVCEMAAEYKAQGLTLDKALKKIYKKYGYYGERVVNYTFSGIEGLKRREEIMNYLRSDVENNLKSYDMEVVY
ncbi:MAG: phospho-sugar mutase, partial [Eubacterium sp.]|nr:phospho-sugar mutase [Eubacterium sp.]